MAQAAGSANVAQIEFWNSPAARAWAEQHERMDRALAPLMGALLEHAAPQPGEHVRDIGCGSGTTVLEFAAKVGAGGQVLGADAATHFIPPPPACCGARSSARPSCRLP